MAWAQRINLLELDVGRDEELPDYEPDTTPEYTRGDYETPMHSYHLRQVDRKLQTFVPYGPLASTSYKIRTRGVRLFSKKPESEVWRISGPEKTEERMACIHFDNDGPLPWRPRAHYSHEPPAGSRALSVHHMESRNFHDWTVEIGNSIYLWALTARPVALEMTELASREVVARFVFSVRGLNASGGADAGDLSIFEHPLSNDHDGVEKIMCGLIIVLANFKKMGKYYWNEEVDLVTRATSILGGTVPPHRASVTTYATV